MPFNTSAAKLQVNYLEVGGVFVVTQSGTYKVVQFYKRWEQGLSI